MLMVYRVVVDEDGIVSSDFLFPKHWLLLGISRSFKSSYDIRNGIANMFEILLILLPDIYSLQIAWLLSSEK